MLTIPTVTPAPAPITALRAIRTAVWLAVNF
jgi:hypothetical protein